MQLTKNFTLAELSATNTGLENVPGEKEIKALKTLCEKCLQPIRNEFGPVKINSGYRCAKVNKAVKGSSTSQHTKGEAADFVMPNMKAVYAWIKENLTYDQLIWEAGTDESPQWIHISFRTRNRKQSLRMKNGKYTAF